jgi:hypothetical protein
VWLIADSESEDADQAAALADQLGWPVQRKKLRFGGLARLHPTLLGPSRLGLDRDGSDPLAPPWPDVVITAGRRTVPVARWIRERSRGRTRLVHVGIDGGGDAALFDAVVVPAYANPWPHRAAGDHRALTQLTARAWRLPETKGRSVRWLPSPAHRAGLTRAPKPGSTRRAPGA